MLTFSVEISVVLRNLHSFPTRRSSDLGRAKGKSTRGTGHGGRDGKVPGGTWRRRECRRAVRLDRTARGRRSEEHTSELQSRGHLVCRLLLEKKNLSQYAN